MRLAKKQKAKLVYAKNQHNNQPIICEQDIINLVNSQTKIVSFANKTNLTGQTLDLSLLSSKIKAINPNCLIIVDATQYFASNKLSCAQSGADFIFGSAHKLYGPHGIGFCYVANQHLLAIKGEK